MAVLLFTVAYTLQIQDGVIFASFLVALIGMAGGLLGTGFGGYLGFIGQNNRRPLLLAAFLVAFLFPFTQNGSDANMSIATHILIFATVALGLNIVVGLAGLLDLGYVAFLGVGAYAAALVSGSPSRAIGVQSPFWAAMLTGAAAAARLRRPHRRPHPAAARRLPRHRHPRLRRDLPHHHQQPRRHHRPQRHQRPQRHPARSPTSRSSGFNFGDATTSPASPSAGSPTTTC